MVTLDTCDLTDRSGDAYSSTWWFIPMQLYCDILYLLRPQNDLPPFLRYFDSVIKHHRDAEMGTQANEMNDFSEKPTKNVLQLT